MILIYDFSLPDCVAARNFRDWRLHIDIFVEGNRLSGALFILEGIRVPAELFTQQREYNALPAGPGAHRYLG